MNHFKSIQIRLVSDRTLTIHPTPPKLYIFSCHNNKSPLLPSEGDSNPLYTYFIKVSNKFESKELTMSSIWEGFIESITLNVTLKAFSCKTKSY